MTAAIPRVGCDLVRVADVEASIARFGERYLRRVFTDVELAETAGAARAERLAARFAAKEAVVKALRLGDELGPWTDIELRREPGGGLEVRLPAGVGSTTTAGRAVVTIDVSVAHEGGLAMATVVAMCGDRTPAPGGDRALIGGGDMTSNVMTRALDDRVREILRETGGIAAAGELEAEANLYDSGLTSHASVNVMLALEDEFDVEFPDALLRKSTFASVGAIEAALEEIGAS